MYRKKNREKQVEEVTISLETLVPEKHILRAIDLFGIRSMRQTIRETLVHRLFVDGTCSPFLLGKIMFGDLPQPTSLSGYSNEY